MNISKKFYPVGNWSNEFFSAEKWLSCDITYDDEGNEIESNHKPMYIRSGSAGEIQAIDDPNKLIPDYLLTVNGVTWRFKPDLSLFNVVDRTYNTSPACVTYNYYKTLEQLPTMGISYTCDDVSCPWVIINSKLGFLQVDIDSFNRPYNSGQNKNLLPTSNNFGNLSNQNSYLFVIKKTDLNKVMIYPYSTVFDSAFNAHIWSLLSDDFCKEFYFQSGAVGNNTLFKSITTLDNATITADMAAQFKSYWALNRKTGVFVWQDTVNLPPAGYDANIVFGAEVWSVVNPAGKRVARFIYNKNKEYFILFKYATGTNVSSYYSTYTFNPSYFYAIKQETYLDDGVSKKRWCYYMYNKQDGYNYSYSTSYDATVPQWYSPDLETLTFTFKKFLPVHDTWTYVNWTLTKETNYVNPFNLVNQGTLDADNVASSSGLSSGYVDGHIWANTQDVYFNIITGEAIK